MNVSLSRVARVNTWLSARAWVWIAGMTTAIVLLGFALVLIVGRVADNATKLSELRYRSCIEDSVVDYKVAEGRLVRALIDRDASALSVSRVDFDVALDALDAAKRTCRERFPA